MKLFFLIFLLGSSAPALAHDCDDLDIQQLNNLDFDNNPAPTQTFRVKRNGGACSFFVTIDNGGASSFSARALQLGSYSLPVQICRDAACSSQLKHLPEATSSNDVLVGSFSSGGPSSVDFNFYPRIGLEDYQAFGRYENNFTVRLYEGSISGNRSLEDSESFRLRKTVSKKIDLSVVDAGGPFDLNSVNKSIQFGALTSGKQASFDLVLKFNAGYRIRVSSQNNGAMKHQSSAELVTYSMSLGGNAVNLNGSSSSPTQVTIGSGTSPAGGLRLPGVFTIGAVTASAAAGNYQDSVTITVATTE